MSYALSVYLVPESTLKRIVGSNDAALLAEALEALAGPLADYDEQMGAPDLDLYDVDLSHADALREIFSGKFTAGVNGSRYGWALECLCRFLGEPLSNEGFSPCKIGWYEELDEELEKHGVALRFEDLIYSTPVKIPSIDDWPCIGHWGAQQVGQADRLAEVAAAVEDPEKAEAMHTAVGWLRAAQKQPGSIIVGFHG